MCTIIADNTHGTLTLQYKPIIYNFTFAISFLIFPTPITGA